MPRKPHPFDTLAERWPAPRYHVQLGTGGSSQGTDYSASVYRWEPPEARALYSMPRIVANANVYSRATPAEAVSAVTAAMEAEEKRLGLS